MLEQYEDVLTIEELQKILSIGRNSAYALLQSGALPSFRIGKKWRVPKDCNYGSPPECKLWGCYS